MNQSVFDWSLRPADQRRPPRHLGRLEWVVRQLFLRRIEPEAATASAASDAIRLTLPRARRRCLAVTVLAYCERRIAASEFAMFGRAFPLFRLFGFSVRADPSWLIVVALVVWTLATNIFPSQHHRLSPTTYWVMAGFGALGLFGSIVLHELAHSLVARRFAMPIRGITLFIFGGVAEMTDEPPTPRAEFSVAIAGPIMSALIAVGALGLWILGVRAGWPAAVYELFLLLAAANASLVVFNIIPAFPLDGGRVLRSILWGIRGNLRRATRITSTLGSIFGVLLICLGAWQAVSDPWDGASLLGGVWTATIGLFLRGAASASYRQLLLRQALDGGQVRRFMTPDPITASADATLRSFVDDHVYQHRHTTFPVLGLDGELIGSVSTKKLKSIPQDRWESATVREIVDSRSIANTTSPDADAMQAFARMQRSGLQWLMVIEGDRLVGLFSSKGVAKLAALRIDLRDPVPEEHSHVHPPAA